MFNAYFIEELKTVSVPQIESFLTFTTNESLDLPQEKACCKNPEDRLVFSN